MLTAYALRVDGMLCMSIRCYSAFIRADIHVREKAQGIGTAAHFPSFDTTLGRKIGME